MSNEPGAAELLGRPSVGGRVFVMTGRVRLGDVDRCGRLRLDSTARLLQDVATDDASDAGLDRSYGWLVRRTMIETRQPAQLGEAVEVATWCTGIGRSWAERRSQIIGARGALIDAVSVWVQIDVGTGRPARIAADFRRAYEVAADGRTVSAQLVLAKPDTSPTAPGFEWAVRRTDLDPFGHGNNAATWEFLEECCAFDESDQRVGRAEMEYLEPVQHGRGTRAHVDRYVGEGGSGLDAWLLQDDRVCVATRWRPSQIVSAG